MIFSLLSTEDEAAAAGEGLGDLGILGDLGALSDLSANRAAVQISKHQHDERAWEHEIRPKSAGIMIHTFSMKLGQ